MNLLGASLFLPLMLKLPSSSKLMRVGNYKGVGVAAVVIRERQPQQNYNILAPQDLHWVYLR